MDVREAQFSEMFGTSEDKMGPVIAVECHALDFVQNLENFFEISLVEMRFLILFVTGRDLKIACRG